jgi:hypothetical protein
MMLDNFLHLEDHSYSTLPFSRSLARDYEHLIHDVDTISGDHWLPLIGIHRCLIDEENGMRREFKKWRVHHIGPSWIGWKLQLLGE